MVQNSLPFDASWSGCRVDEDLNVVSGGVQVWIEIPFTERLVLRADMQACPIAAGPIESYIESRICIGGVWVGTCVPHDVVGWPGPNVGNTICIAYLPVIHTDGLPLLQHLDRK